MVIHIGNKIKEVVDKITISNMEEFCLENLQMTKQNFYRILKKPSIHTDLLYRFSIVFNYDFFNFFYEDPSLFSISKRETEKLKLEIKELTSIIYRKEDLVKDLERKISLLKEETTAPKNKKVK